MSFITNLSIDERNNKISFLLKNNDKIKISFANALRRIIIANIHVHIMGKTVFFENSSMIDNEFLEHRLKLIPINCDYIDSISKDYENIYENIVISCKKSNINNENLISVYPSDFVCKIGDKELENSKIFPYPNILWGKLKMNQKISFESRLVRNNQEYGGSFFEPVSKCVYTFGIDEKKSNEIMKNMPEEEQKKFSTLDIARVYSKTSNGEPSEYIFNYVSIGFYSCMYILKKGVEILINKLLIIKNEMKKNNSVKLYIYQNKENINFINFDINDENDTIGNLLATYLTEDKDVFFAGYIIEHPLKKNFILKIQLKENNSVENIILKLTEVINLLLSYCSDISKDIN
jgi:DNA-directed RNA polymerase subunit L